MKIIDEQNRSVLFEGRTHGVGFAFAKLDKNTFTTVMPISPCKDYLNDVVFVENTGKEIGIVYGFNYKISNCINKNTYSYLITKVMMPNKSNIKHFSFDEEELALLTNWKNIQLVMNYFEDLLDIEYKTETKLIDKYLILYIPDWWCKEPWRISFYTLIVRNAIYYNGKEKIEDFFKNHKKDDYFILTGLLDKIKKIAKLKKKNELNKINYPVYNKEVQENPQGYKVTIHNAGICSVTINE